MCLLELWFSQGICPVVGLLGHMVVFVLFFFFKEYSTLFSITAASVYIPTKSAWGFYLEPVIDSEVSQKEKNKYRILTHIYGI